MANQTENSREQAQKVAAEAAAQLVRITGEAHHEIALVLGSGWSGATDLLGETIAEVAAAEISGFRSSEVAGHTSVFKSIRLSTGKVALVLGARTHLYQGYGVDAVVHPIRVAKLLGAKTLVLTNGCGAVNPKFSAGQPVLISDHINLTATSPLSGAEFFDMSEVYSQRLRGLALDVDGSLDSGVYAQFRGPQYETPAEIRMARVLGADLVGMSTALEAIAARALGIEVLGLSLVTNLAAGVSQNPLSHAEVLAAGEAAAPKLSSLLSQIVSRL